jgi:hypothetical protein
MSDLSLEYLKEHKCRHEGCYNFCARGLIYCEEHMYGFPKTMDEEDIKRLQDEKKNLFNQRFDEFLTRCQEVAILNNSC